MTARVLTRTQLLRECGGDRQLRAALVRGDWSRVLRGVYAQCELPDLEVRARAAALVLPPGAVVADHSALWLCGVDVLPPGPPVLEVLVAPGRTTPRRCGLRARQGALATGDVGRVRGVPTVRPARATVDLLRRLPVPDAVAVADAVRYAGLCHLEPLEAELDRHAGLRGVCLARTALRLSSPLAESPPESRLRAQLVLAGLEPVPSTTWWPTVSSSPGSTWPSPRNGSPWSTTGARSTPPRRRS